MPTIDVEGRVSVDELLEALGLESVPEGCELKLDAEVEITITADAEALRDELEDMFDDDRETVPLEELRAAVSALRDGDTRMALVLFDSVFGGMLTPEMAVIEGALLTRKAA